MRDLSRAATLGKMMDVLLFISERRAPFTKWDLAKAIEGPNPNPRNALRWCHAAVARGWLKTQTPKNTKYLMFEPLVCIVFREGGGTPKMVSHNYRAHPANPNGPCVFVGCGRSLNDHTPERTVGKVPKLAEHEKQRKALPRVTR